ncbi:hypothetical protein Y032_0003g1597 [Ancylostoma ceylanicum]|uniref:Uncharacterized protein n=1 Tax=Ancylostoma ceylanicum TaxID=53326 RepID=A0A016VZN1_9BILA|nr:hypothetical protein Y032_0003g1597 [Ancylostoma ceylanicum]
MIRPIVGDRTSSMAICCQQCRRIADGCDNGAHPFSALATAGRAGRRRWRRRSQGAILHVEYSVSLT